MHHTVTLKEYTHLYTINTVVKSKFQEYEIKFSYDNPDKELFVQWCKDHNGEYMFNWDAGKQDGSLPVLPDKEPFTCWCECIEYWLSNNGYQIVVQSDKFAKYSKTS
jgi:hypothetical protein